MPDPAKIFRIFLSSTFRDLENERNALQKIVFPRLSALCRKHGYSFHAVDLRFGIGEHVANEHRTMRVCVEEIERCKKISPKPNFVVLLGERYGWRPLPEEIPAGDFAAINEKIDNQTDKKLVADWYRLDENAVPPVYCLQPRSGHYEDPTIWREAESELRAIFSAATERAGFSQEKRSSYLISATEHEIIKGLFESPGAEYNSCCFIMNIEAGEEDKRILSSAGFIESDPESAGLLSELKRRIKKNMRANLFEYCVKTQDGKPTDEHLEGFCFDVEKTLTWLIMERINEDGIAKESEAESSAHEDFARERSAHFTGREESVELILEYIDEIKNGAGASKDAPLLIHAPSGAGKTSLLSKAAIAAAEKFKESAVVMRFVGATPRSADPDTLVLNIASELSLGQAFQTELPSVISYAAGKKNVIIFIDALDQVFGSGAMNIADIIPAALPKNARLIISALESEGENGEVLRLLKDKIPPCNHLALPQMDLSDGMKMIRSWLGHAGRKLTEAQLSIVSGKIEKCRIPLYFRLVFERIKRLRSYEPLDPADIGDDINGVFKNIFDSLRKDHPKAATNACLQALSLSRHGLSEDEIVDAMFSGLLRDDHTVKIFRHFEPNGREEADMDGYFSRENSAAGGRARGENLVTWSRMRFDLSAYLTERKTRIGLMINSYHRCFDEAVLKEFYKTDTDRFNAHLKMAEFFRNRLLFGNREVTELPWHLSMANAWPNLYELLSDPKYIKKLWEANKSEAQTYWTLVEKKDVYFKMADAYSGLIENPDDNFESLEAVSELFFNSGKIAEAASIIKHLIRICRAREDHAGLSRALLRQAGLFENRGEYETAEKLLDECEKTLKDAGLEADLPKVELAREKLHISRRDLRSAGQNMAIRENEPENPQAMVQRAGELREKGRAMLLSGKYDEAVSIFTESLKLFNDSGEMSGVAASLHGLATALSCLGKYEEAMKNFKESEAILRRVGDKKGISDSLNNQASAIYRKGDYDEALRLHRESGRLYRELGNKRGTADSLYNQGLILYAQGKFDESEAMYAESEKFYRELGDDTAIANAIYNRTLILYSSRKYDRALALYEESEKIYRRIGDRENTANCLADQANIYYHNERYETALNLYHESEKIYREIGKNILAVNILYNSANILFVRNDISGAMKLYQQCEAEYRKAGDDRGTAGTLYMKARIIYRTPSHGSDALKHAKEALALAERSQAKDLAVKIGNLIEMIEGGISRKQ